MDTFLNSFTEVVKLKLIVIYLTEFQYLTPQTSRSEEQLTFPNLQSILRALNSHFTYILHRTAEFHHTFLINKKPHMITTTLGK